MREIELGQRVLQALDSSKYKVRAAFWARFLDDPELRLILIMPEVDSQGPLNVYSRIEKLLTKNVPSFPLRRLSVIGPKDPEARMIRNSLAHGAASSSSSTAWMWHGSAAEAAYIYPLAAGGWKETG